MNNNFVKFNLPEIPFRVATLQEHFFNNVQSEDYKKAKQYIQEYYFETSCGMYYFYNVNQKCFECREKKDFTNEVLKKVETNKSIVKYFEMNSKIYSVVSRLDRPLHYCEDGNYYINECKGLKHKNYKNYDEYDTNVKENVQKMLNFMLEITCSNDAKMFDSLVKYYSQICKGIKTEVILYKKSIEGVGKSTESDFIMDHVLGRDVAVIGNSDPLLTPFNKCLMGKLLIVFEELPTFSDAQWQGVSSKLKTLTTEKHTYYQDKYEKQMYAENLNNFIVNTNVEAIKSSDGRRIAILEISHKRFRDHQYFDDLRKNCFNDTVGEAFFSYLMTKVDVSNFYGQRDFPETDKKKTAIANLLPLVHKFLKFEYLLKNKPIAKLRTSDLYNTFVSYCMSGGIKSLGRNDFYDRLSELGINRSTKTNGQFYFNFSMEQLQQLSNKYKWICKYDDEDTIPSSNISENDDDCVDYKQKYLEILAELEELKQQSNDKSDEISVLTESTVSIETEESIVEDNIAIYRETYKEQFEQLEKYTKNIQIINKKLKKYENAEELEELAEQHKLLEKLNKNKDKYSAIMNSFSAQVQSVVEKCFSI